VDVGFLFRYFSNNNFSLKCLREKRVRRLNHRLSNLT
jgi:hypothetical protein